MKRLLIVNPNTSAEMTEDIRATVMAVKSPWAEVDVRRPGFGPRSLESFHDYSLAAFAMLREFGGQEEAYDGALICCFGDPGLYALKEHMRCPVLGIAEASMSLALLLGQRFSILAASEKAVPMMRDMVGQYGLTSRLASVEAVNGGNEHRQQMVQAGVGGYFLLDLAGVRVDAFSGELLGGL